ncbi:hypothetical protein KKF45_05155 [Patescibacteria group bacterium]|nr:hypothetical protein [Patescibacteria group bacterium]
MAILTATFTVPADVSHKRVIEAGMLYCRKFVDAMEVQGWKPESKLGLYGPTIEGDRKRYWLKGYFGRPPQLQVIEVGNNHVERILREYPEAQLKD